MQGPRPPIAGGRPAGQEGPRGLPGLRSRCGRAGEWRSLGRSYLLLCHFGGHSRLLPEAANSCRVFCPSDTLRPAFLFLREGPWSVTGRPPGFPRVTCPSPAAPIPRATSRPPSPRPHNTVTGSGVQGGDVLPWVGPRALQTQRSAGCLPVVIALRVWEQRSGWGPGGGRERTRSENVGVGCPCPPEDK